MIGKSLTNFIRKDPSTGSNKDVYNKLNHHAPFLANERCYMTMLYENVVSVKTRHF